MSRSDRPPGWTNDDRITPPHVIQIAREVMGGGIDLDPASSAEANKIVKATTWIGKKGHGSGPRNSPRHPWRGRIWLNPPCSRPLCSQFIFRALEEYKKGCTDGAGIVIMILVNNATETKWFQPLLRYPVCLIAGRLSFHLPVRGAVREARQGQALFYLGPSPRRFSMICLARKIGTVFLCPEYGSW